MLVSVISQICQTMIKTFIKQRNLKMELSAVCDIRKISVYIVIYSNSNWPSRIFSPISEASIGSQFNDNNSNNSNNYNTRNNMRKT